ncbi:unnamed protein product [Parajaminaea phylloscopi]
MKLDATDIRYITADEFRVLKGVEQGSRAHHVVPSASIPQLSGLHHSGLNRLIASLAKRNLIAREQNIKYDGYRLTYGGYDFLAVRAMKEKDHVQAVGHRIGVGKESDIYLVSAPEPSYENRILKIHRLGRISFRAVKSKRDYTSKTSQRQNFSWMYLSRLAAAKEYQFMQVLHRHGFPVPQPLAQSRHTVLMSLIDAYPLRQIAELPSDQIPLLYSALMALIVRLARAGLIHGDFNEFNLLVLEKRGADDDDADADDEVVARSVGRDATATAAHDEEDSPLQLQPGERLEQGKGFERVVAAGPPTPHANDAPDGEGDDDSEDSDEDDDSNDDSSAHGSESSDVQVAEDVRLADGSTVEPILIDFPQMVSVMHPNAEYFFDRDVACVRRFFSKRFRFVSEEFPRFSDVVESSSAWEVARAIRERRRQEGSVSDKSRRKVAEPDEVVREQSEWDEGFLDLDLLTKASGYIKADKQRGQMEELDQYLNRMRMQGSSDSAANQGASSDEEGGEHSGEEGSDSGEEAPSEPEDEGPDEDSPDDTRPREKRSTARARFPESGESSAVSDDVAAQVLLERRRADRADLKHHGRKSTAGKVGKSLLKTSSGGKKKGAKFIVNDASVF